MGSFLDKVGLQHFVEKIKGLLSGYLPLSGGTMTGDIVYTDKATLNGEQLDYISSSSKALEESILRPIELVMTCRGNHDTYGVMQLGVSRLDVGGLYLRINGETASLNTEKCEVQKFVLSTDSNQGLIANDSNTVVKELSDEQVDKLLAGDTSTISDSKYYVSGANLGRFAQNVAKDNSHTIIKTNGIVKITTSKGEVTVPTNVYYHIYEDYKITSGKNNVNTLIQSGYAQKGNKYFDGLSNLSTIDVSKLNISNIKDLSFYFRGCSSLYGFKSADNVAYWDTKEVGNFAGMFTGCTQLTTLYLYFWDTRNVSNMSTMFAGCTNLKTLNLSGWNTQSVNIMSNMFSGCSAITSLYLSEDFGRMSPAVGSLDLSALTKWTDTSVQTLLKLYNRKANKMSVVTIKLSSATKEALGTNGIQTLTAKGYTIA